MNIIELHQLSFAWPDGQLALDIPALQVQQGERLFIKGASGSGKSTLLSLLAGIQIPRSGSLRVLDHSLGGLSARARDRFRADHLGYIFQQFNLLPFLGVLDNVLCALTFSPCKRARIAGDPRQEARRLLTALQLPAALHERPVHRLSVGQQQRVAAARALIGAPPLVIADEPTSALDSDNRTAFLQLLFAECERQGSTLLFVSHDAQLEPLFDRAENMQLLNRRPTC